MVNAARFFFWFLLIINVVKDYFTSISGQSLITESFFPLIESLQFPIIVFTLFSLYCLGYGHNVFSSKVNKLIGSLYVINSLYLMLTPIIVYWDQSSDITIDIIVFCITDFWIFYILWRKENVVKHD